METDFTDHGIDPETGLPLRKRMFADYYLSHLNATRAYKEAGYGATTYQSASTNAAALLNEHGVREYVGQKMTERRERLGVSADRTLRNLQVVADSRINQYRINPDTGDIEVRPGVPEEAIGAVRSFKWRTASETEMVDGREVRRTVVQGEIVLWDKLKALDTLCKHLGLVTTDLPPLEVLLNRLPPPVANLLRQLLAGGVPTREPEPTTGFVGP